jgi:NADPH:quinone reductase-like Zn-dependent oxidoreductase
VRGAAGSIGIAAIELASAAGAGTIAVTTSNAERGLRLRSLGATDVLDRAGDGPSAATSFDVVFDLVGGPLTPSFIDRLAPNGRLILVGAVGGFPPADFGGALLAGFQRSISVGTFSLDTVGRAELARVRSDQFEAAVRGDLHPIVHEVLPLELAIEAHSRIDAGEVFGRIVLTP